MYTFYHRGAYGDIIYAMPTIRHFKSTKVILKNQKHFDFMSKLLLSQSYVNEVTHLGREGVSWEDADINLDEFRKINREDRAKHLVYCHGESASLIVSLSHQWLNVKPVKFKPIIINRTKRYHDSEDIDWSLLKRHEEKCGFVGDKDEYKEFSRIAGFSPKFLRCYDALHLANVIAGSSLFVGNQSLAFSIAEGTKVNRVLEVCENQPNCIPNTANGYVGKDLKEAIGNHL